MQAANQATLANMQDIISPAPVGIWPFAYGYYLVAICLILLSIFIAYKFKRRQQRSAPKREALKQLAELDIHGRQLAIEVNALLKRSAISYLPREQIAALEGEAWTRWLAQQVKQMDPAFASLLARRYQPTPLSAEEATQLISLAKDWLEQALPIDQSKENTCSR